MGGFLPRDRFLRVTTYRRPPQQEQPQGALPQFYRGAVEALPAPTSYSEDLLEGSAMGNLPVSTSYSEDLEDLSVPTSYSEDLVVAVDTPEASTPFSRAAVEAYPFFAQPYSWRLEDEPAANVGAA